MSEHLPDVDHLLPCPFCSGQPRWCKDNEHECHLIVCTGCAISIDFQENPDTETVQQLRDILAAKWNKRA